ncbi:A/G-specific adenine glycosylase [bacterium]|nr:A/G-specific adenine glycosylase [bacterium]
MAGHLKNLLSWYDQNKRDLPWRKTRDPYEILVSEVMLQQTKVESVRNLYRRFLDKFPTSEALAHSSETLVLEAWEGLGYYSRARNLKKTCEWIHENFGGNFPQETAELRKLPGIGDYTSAALASIAFDQTVAVLDGNVFRFVSRFGQIKGNPSRRETKKEVHHVLSRDFLDPYRPGDSNQALMELGALVCTPRLPKCSQCPVKVGCLSSRYETQSQFPQKIEKEGKVRIWLYLYLGTMKGELLVASSSWRGYQPGYSFPLFLESSESMQKEQVVSYLEELCDEDMEDFVHAGSFTHHITRYHLRCEVYKQKSLKAGAYECLRPKSTILKKALGIL